MFSPHKITQNHNHNDDVAKLVSFYLAEKGNAQSLAQLQLLSKQQKQTSSKDQKWLVKDRLFPEYTTEMAAVPKLTLSSEYIDSRKDLTISISLEEATRSILIKTLNVNVPAHIDIIAVALIVVLGYWGPAYAEMPLEMPTEHLQLVSEGDWFLPTNDDRNDATKWIYRAMKNITDVFKRFHRHMPLNMSRKGGGSRLEPLEKRLYDVFQGLEDAEHFVKKRIQSNMQANTTELTDFADHVCDVHLSKWEFVNVKRHFRILVRNSYIPDVVKMLFPLAYWFLDFVRITKKDYPGVDQNNNNEEMIFRKGVNNQHMPVVDMMLLQSDKNTDPDLKEAKQAYAELDKRIKKLDSDIKQIYNAYQILQSHANAQGTSVWTKDWAIDDVKTTYSKLYKAYTWLNRMKHEAYFEKQKKLNYIINDVMHKFRKAPKYFKP